MQSPRQYLKRLLARLGLGTLVTIAVPLFIVILCLRFVGLPAVVKDYLLQEIERRHLLPFPVSVDRLLLAPTGALLADRVTVFRDAGRQNILLQVDQVRVSFAWLSWWRGRGFIDSAGISNAEVSYPVGSETIDFHEVNAEVAFDGRDIKIEDAQARFLNLAILVRGVVHNDGLAAAKSRTAEEIKSQEKSEEDLWRTVRQSMDDIGTERPIDVDLEFESSTRDLGGGRANFSMDGRHLTWRGAPVNEFSIHGSLSDGVVSLTDFKIGLDRGELTAYGEWRLAERNAELQFNSTMDISLMAPAFPGPLGEALKRLDFSNSPPLMTGRVLFDFDQGFHADVQTDVDWRDFTFNGTSFDRLSIPLAYDGHRLLIPGLKISGTAGNVDLEMFFDGTTADAPGLKAKIISNLDPTVLKGVFGEGMDNFLGSCSFKDGGPKIEATASGSALKTDAWTIKGKLSADKFVYKNAGFDTATSDFTFADSKLNLPNLELHRPEGTGEGGIVYDFKNRAVELHNMVAQVNVAEVAPVMGPKFTEYTKPYRFARPPLVRANGKVDLQSQKKDLDTDLLVEVTGKSPMEWTLFGVPFSFDSPGGTLVFKNHRMTVNMKQAGFYDGSLVGVIDMDLRQTPANYTLDLTMNKVNFKKFMTRVYNYDKSNGQFNLTTHLAGAIGKMDTMTGTGEAKVEDGDITQIPFLGSLTPLIPGFSIADAAHGDFTVAKGVVHTENLHISSEFFALIGNGSYDFIKDRLNLDMRVNANLFFSLPLYPISKIFEYHGSGPMKDPLWVPKHF